MMSEFRSGRKRADQLAVGDLVYQGAHGYRPVRAITPHPSGWLIVTTGWDATVVPAWADVLWCGFGLAEELAAEMHADDGPGDGPDGMGIG